MAAEWWWFLALNAVVAAIAVLSSRARLPLASASPRRGAGVTRRASSAVLQRLRSLSIFSFPSACFHTAPFLQPDATADAAVSQETEEPVTSPFKSPSRALALAAPPTAEEDEEEDPTAMSMEDAYALALATRRRPEREREEEARRSEVDAKAEEFIREFREDLRQQRLNSIFNYTQRLKQRALGTGGRQPAAR
ncbi:pathogen-associated molecular patterns-induced protein A70-like [Phragmites australis]|uniref:pathogen-associated molecular patterns-induced protein A70-like n=1 Tax=Phragmites australis TaxID=29695 RepID=UPI002D7653FC|nr:pathogen-associated molecular patterns-induced protein A70-like [Phragmites australis]